MRDQGVRKVFSTSVTAFKVTGQESRFRGKTILTGPVGHYVGGYFGQIVWLGTMKCWPSPLFNGGRMQRLG